MSTAQAIQLRSAVSHAGTVRVQGHTVYGASIITAGDALGHGFKIDAITLRQVAEAINANERVKVLFTHSQDNVDALANIAGYAHNARVEGSAVRADIHLFESSQHAPFLLELAETIPGGFGASIEADKFKLEQIGGEQLLRVFSIDAIAVTAKPAANQRGLLSKGNLKMNEKELATMRELLGLDENATVDDILAAIKSLAGGNGDDDANAESVAMSAGNIATLTTTAIKDERKRGQAMREIASAMKLSADYANRWIDGGLTIAEAGQAAVQLRAKLDAASTPTFGGGGNATPKDNRMNNESIMTAATLCHLGRKDLAERHFKDSMPQVLRLNCNSALDLCRAAVHLDGRESPGDNHNQTIKLAFSNSSLPTALGGSIDRIVEAAWSQATRSFGWAGIKSAKSFREHTAVRLNVGHSSLEKVPPGGTIPHGTLGESTYAFRVDTYARMLAVTRQDLINDDLGVLSDLANALAMEAPRAVADLLYGLILDNTGTFFGTGNLNFDDGADSVLSVDSLSAAITSMRKMTDERGRLIDLQPRALLVTPENESNARQILNSLEVKRDVSSAGDNAPAGNPHSNSGLELFIESRLSSTDFHASATATQWYLFADKINPTFVVSYLDGKETPTVETSDADFSTLGMQIRAFSDIGAAQANFRTGYKAAGA